MTPGGTDRDPLLDTDDMDDPSYRDLLWEITCSFPQLLGMSIALSSTLLLLSVYSYLNLDPDQLGYTIARIDIVLLTVFLLVTIPAFARCLQ